MFSALLPRMAAAQQQSIDYRLSVGDSIRVQVFQSPDLTVETRISDNGAISYPLIGTVELAGLSIADAERKIAQALRTGNFLVRPQVNIVLLQVRGNQVAVLGHASRPGRFPLDTANIRVTEVLAMAGGATATGADYVILTGTRDGRPYRKTIDITALFMVESSENDVAIAGGDVLYVPRAPMFYIYGEAQRPGAYRIERGMTVMQALATGGGPTTRGSETRLRLHRRDAAGVVQQTTPQFSDALQPDDVIYVRESLF
ncbi:polysaccharide export protein EpsE [Pseudorhodoferax sp. Leaf274]|nr:polysaccharide export protein EpsE [Pseudorhodoferax sp. Leaf274]